MSGKTAFLSEIVLPVVSSAPAGAGRGGLGSVLVASAQHEHEWGRVPETVGLFRCGDDACLWYAVCPGCLNSLDVAIRARAGIPGMALYWCPMHRRGEDV